MASWPRVISRGKLKGETFGSEREYRKALSQALGGITRHEQRNRLAQKLGFKNYAERRKAKETIGEKRFLAMKRSMQPKRANILLNVIRRERELFNKSTTEDRRRRMREYLEKYGSDMLGEQGFKVWAELYRNPWG